MFHSMKKKVPLSRELYPAISLPTTLFSYSTSLSLLSILVLTIEEEDIVVGFETVGPRSHDKEELPDTITTGGQVAGLCPTTASMV